MKKLSWTPVRKGKTYCAPACGRGCTHKEYLEARAAAAKLCKLLGPAWKPRIWENLGWHYEVRLATMTVYTATPGYYHAFYEAGQQFTATAGDPRVAVVEAYAQAQELVARTMAANAVLRAAILWKPGIPKPLRRLRG